MGARRLGGVAVAAVLLATAAPTHAHADVSQVRAAAEDLGGAAFDAKDDSGVGLDALEVLQLGPSRYAGVSHALVDGHFQVRLSTSSDLRSWRFQRVLAQDGSMPAIAAAPGGGFVVADERGSTLRLLPPLSLPASITGPTRLWMLQKSQLRFRFYRTAARLLAGRADRTYVAPRRLSPTNEGTPSISVFRDGPGVGGLRIETGLHYFKDLDGDGSPDADRQGTGTMRGFRTWTATARPDIDAQFLGATAFHAPFAAPLTGSIGDRDDVVLPDGTRATIAEGQYTFGDFGTWRLFLRDPSGGPATPLTPVTPGRSTSLGNPSLTTVTLPDGRPALVFTAFVFGVGAAPGEAGEVARVLPLA